MIRLSKQDSIKERIFFMHVGKCGGTSITAALREKYQRLDHPKREFFWLQPSGSRQAAELLGRDKWDYRDDLLFYFMANSRTSCIAGHFRFNEQLYEMFHDKFAFVTVLREPVSQFLSTYFYHRYKSHTSHARIHEDLEMFVKRPQSHAVGYQYVAFLARHCGVEDYTSQEALDIAQKNLAKFDLVGVLESLPLFKRRFQELFGENLVIPHKWKTKKPKDTSEAEISPAILEEIRELCQPNQKLYDFAVRELIARS